MGGLEKNALEFVFDVKNTQFNHEGRFYLRLSVISSYVIQTQRNDLYDKIRVQKGDDKFLKHTNSVTTDVLDQTKRNKTYKFTDHKFTFYLPAG